MAAGAASPSCSPMAQGRAGRRRGSSEFRGAAGIFPFPLRKVARGRAEKLPSRRPAGGMVLRESCWEVLLPGKVGLENECSQRARLGAPRSPVLAWSRVCSPGNTRN